nr:glycosyltransferase family 1 protein [Bacillus sp. V3-13]
MAFAQTPANDRGVGVYTRQLIKSIQLLGQEHCYYYFQPDSPNTKEELMEQMKAFISENKIDIYHIHSTFDYYNYFSLHRNWFGDAKLAVTLYDIIPLLFENQYLPLPEMKEHYMQNLEFVKSCDIIFAISDTTKQDAVEQLNINPEKIKVIYGGLCDHFSRENQLMETKWNGTKKPYILYVGGCDYRKNLDRLIEAFAKVNHRLKNKYQLIIAGNIPEDQRFFIKLNIKKANVTEDVLFTGFVSNEELVQLYKGAELFAFPSLYEGFGLPVLEAMACGVPVLTSNTSALKEIAGEAAYLVNPKNINEIAQGMEHLLTNTETRNTLVKRGFKRVKQFQWTNVAKRVLKGYQQLFE